ncbi:MAG: SDR family NAD(P)-dependent oxidoreductase [Alphaproteobacteria bacterium]|nr:SDR family NAD(P)-dependent oxidoreductase [Alphaproteobacteria bacterium]
MTRPAPRAAVITGASDGLGAAFAAALPAETALLLHGRSASKLAAVAEALTRPGRRVEVVTGDLMVPADRKALAEAAAAFQPDLLIPQAGFGVLGRVVDNLPTDETGMVLVNCLAPVELVHALLPDMLARARAGGPRAGVILVASVAAFQPLARFATYAASKAFDLAYAEGLAEEMRGDPVDVLALCPGATRTGFFARANMAGPPGGGSRPLADPSQVARAALAALGRQTVLVPGVANNAVPLAARLLPRGLARRLAGAAMAKVSAGGGGR